jgi:Icc-related predicted phosphoesterase
MAFHARSKAWLQKEFEDTLAHHTLVVITHHAPSIASVRPELREDALTPAFASNLDDIVSGSGAALWIHGHIHSSASYTLGRTRVVCNPRGYSFEPNPEFDPGLILEV